MYESDLLYAVKFDGTEITLKNKTSDKFPVNARILIIEMQALSSGTQSTVGNYEFAEVDSYISDDEIKLKNALTKHLILQIDYMLFIKKDTIKLK